MSGQIGKGRSPYARQQKTPYRYSSEYYEWRSAVLSNKDADAREADAKWRARFLSPTVMQEAA
jgi:hypothetical protein